MKGGENSRCQARGSGEQVPEPVGRPRGRSVRLGFRKRQDFTRAHGDCEKPLASGSPRGLHGRKDRVTGRQAVLRSSKAQAHPEASGSSHCWARGEQGEGPSHCWLHPEGLGTATKQSKEVRGGRAQGQTCRSRVRSSGPTAADRHGQASHQDRAEARSLACDQFVAACQGS